MNPKNILVLGGGFKYFLLTPLPGEMIQFDEHIFQVGWFNHQPEYLQVDGKQKRFQKPHDLQLHLATATL